MANKTTTEQKDTDVALLKIDFMAPAEFKLPNKAESIKIIAAKREHNKTLVIAGVEDKTSYEAVKEAMAEMKNNRIALVDAATTSVITPATNYLSKFKEDLNAIVDEFKAGEKDMRDKKDAIDAEKERLKEEKRLAQQRVIEARINDLFVLGAVLDAKLYTFPYDGSLVINSLQVSEFDDKEFGEFLEDVKTAYADEQERLNFEQQLVAERELEAKEEAQRQRELAQQNEQQAIALNEKRAKLRTKELTMLGFYYDGASYLNEAKPHIIEPSAINEMPDAAWETLIEEISLYVPFEEEVLPEVSFFPGGVRQGPEIPEEFQQTDVETLVETISVVLEELRFERNNRPYVEIKLTTKMFVRVFPDEFTGEANDGVEAVNHGIFQPRMSWLVYKLK